MGSVLGPHTLVSGLGARSRTLVSGIGARSGTLVSGLGAGPCTLVSGFGAGATYSSEWARGWSHVLS